MLQLTVHEVSESIEVDMKTILDMIAFVAWVAMSLAVDLLADIVVPEDRERLVRNFKNRAAGGAAENQEFTAITRSGVRFPFNVFAMPILQENSFQGMRGILIDISNRKKIEDALRANEEKYRQLTENSQDLVCELDNRGTRGSLPDGPSNGSKTLDFLGRSAYNGWSLSCQPGQGKLF